MKKIIFPFILLPFHLFAQPTINQAQFGLTVGDILTAYPQTYAAPAEGASQTWDYTTLDLSNPSAVNVINSTSSSLSGLPPSTLCTVSPSQEDCFLIDASGMQRTGLGGSGISLPYQDHEYIFQFPITYGDSIVDSFHSTFTIGSFPGSRTGTTTVEVVGYGTMMLPGSITINNAMLVRTHEQYIDSVDVGTWSVTSFDMVTHYFYAAGYHGYILMMVAGTATPGGPVSIGYYNELASGAGMESYDISANLEVYPNPVEDHLTITNKGNIGLNGFEYKIMNMQGQVMETGILNEDNLNFDVSAFSSGVYILNINGENFNASKRFIKK